MDRQYPASSQQKQVCVFIGQALANYGFGSAHPFGTDRMQAFWTEACARGLDQQVEIGVPVMATEADLLTFHRQDYVARVKQLSLQGEGFLDCGDTPAFRGVFEAASVVVGTTLQAVDYVMQGRCHHAMVPIAGLHHARRHTAAGFCVFNDCGVAIEVLRNKYQLRRIAYVDIDAHHGDGVFYSFADDPDIIFADIHEDGTFLYPGTGAAAETGTGQAVGTKLNIPMPPHATDEAFFQCWDTLEQFVREGQPEFILFQCGADSLAGDPITHLRFSEKAHAYAAQRLCAMADASCQGRLIAMGGGGYNRINLARAWTAVLEQLLGQSGDCPNER